LPFGAWSPSLAATPKPTPSAGVWGRSRPHREDGFVAVAIAGTEDGIDAAFGLRRDGAAAFFAGISRAGMARQSTMALFRASGWHVGQKNAS
jgi:hypothetical protein